MKLQKSFDDFGNNLKTKEMRWGSSDAPMDERKKLACNIFYFLHISSRQGQ
jgi:hypothetical protein